MHTVFGSMRKRIRPVLWFVACLRDSSGRGKHAFCAPFRLSVRLESETVCLALTKTRKREMGKACCVVARAIPVATMGDQRQTPATRS